MNPDLLPQYILPPNSAVFLGCIGKDKYAEILQDAANQASLRVEYRIDEAHPTGRCGVIVTGHNRSMCTDLGAANHYRLEHLKQPEVWKLVEGAKIYYIGGYHLTVCVPAVMALAEEAAVKNKVGRLVLSVWNISRLRTALMSYGISDLCSFIICTVYPSVLQGPARPDGSILGLRYWKRN